MTALVATELLLEVVLVEVVVLVVVVTAGLAVEVVVLAAEVTAGFAVEVAAGVVATGFAVLTALAVTTFAVDVELVTTGLDADALVGTRAVEVLEEVVEVLECDARASLALNDVLARWAEWAA